MSTLDGVALIVSGLTKRFGGLVAVKDMALQVGAGEILGLIGPNGSGKSTVMKLIMGIERPDKGSVRINGTEVAGWPSHKIARMGAGIVFQHSRPLHRQTVLENIKLALLPDIHGKDAIDQARHAFNVVIDKQHRAAVIAQFANKIGEGGSLRRCEAGEGLVDKEHLRIAGDGFGNLNLA